MVNGKVRLYNSAWKFGFIVMEDGGQVLFRESSLCDGHVRHDDLVEFEINESSKGIRAVNVRKI